ncbi:MAG: NUDIX domain-containing protein [Patescibacteria group bacterium]
MKAGADYIGVGAGALIFNDKNEVLLIKRSENARVEAGMWSRPGGEIEFGEKATEAVKREIKEEVNIDIEVLETLDFQETISKDPKKHWIALGFLCKQVGGELKNNEPDKHTDLQWFALDKLPENISPYTKSSVEVFLKKKK